MRVIRAERVGSVIRMSSIESYSALIELAYNMEGGPD
jgi:hypothetical protein